MKNKGRDNNGAYMHVMCTYFPQERSPEVRRLALDAVELLRLRASSKSELRRLLVNDPMLTLPSLLRRRCIRATRPLPLRGGSPLELKLLALRDDESDSSPDNRRDGCE